MDSYDFSRETGRPVSPPLPEDYSMSYLPQMATYSGSTQSRNTSVSRPIDFGGSTSRYTGATQSRNTSVSQPIDFGGSTSRYTGATQSRRTSGQQISLASSSQRPIYTPEYRSSVVTSWRSSNESQLAYARRIGLPPSTLGDWVREEGSSTQSRPYATQSRTHYTPEDKTAALSVWRARGERETYVDVATRVGIPAATLYKWIQKSEGSARSVR